MASIKPFLDKIRTAVYGEEVRGSLADGLDAVNKETEDATELTADTKRRQDSVEQQFDDVQQNATDISPSDVEIVAARTNTETGDNHTTVGRRMDAEYKQVTAQLAETGRNVSNLQKESATKQELQQGLVPKADQSFVDAQFASIVSGAPKGTFSNLQALKDAYPNGEEGIFLVLSDAHWYYWNDSQEDWFDGGLYQSQGIGDHTVTPEKTTFAQVDQRNIFNKYKAIDGYRLDSDGNDFKDEEYTLSEYIEVEKGHTYKVGFAVEGFNVNRICAYDFNENHLKNLTNGPTYGELTIDITVDFNGLIRIPFEKSGKNFALIARTDYYDGFHSYKIIGSDDFFTNPKKSSVGEDELIGESVTEEKTTFARKTKNLFDKRKTVKNKVLSRVEGKTSDLDEYSVSEFIKVEKGNEISLSNPRNVALYDDNENYLGFDSFIDNPDNDKITITPPIDGYIRASLKTEYLDYFQIVKGSSIGDYEPKGVIIPDLLMPNPLRGKKILGFGDSIAKGKDNGYLEMIGNKNDMIIANYGSDGATISPREGYDNQVIKKVSEAISDNQSADYITFNGLTNDANVTDESRLGDITSGYDMPADVTTFSGAFEELVKTMRDNWINSKIIYVRVHNMDSRGERQKVFGERAIEICSKWSIPVVDIYNEGNLNTHISEMKRIYTVDTYETGEGDGTHPNEEGYQKFYVPMIESKIKSI